jgi:hypothetical protein
MWKLGDTNEKYFKAISYVYSSIFSLYVDFTPYWNKINEIEICVYILVIL